MINTDGVAQQIEHGQLVTLLFHDCATVVERLLIKAGSLVRIQPPSAITQSYGRV